MKTRLITLLLAAGAACSVHAQSAPVGGSDAKSNAPIKHAHTVNDGAAKPAANSFTRAQAMRHIEHSGFTGVSGLTEGKDGIWRGTAMKGGSTVNVAMDFKGNVSQGAVATSTAMAAPMAASSAATAPMAAPMTGPATSTPAAPMHHGLRHRRRHHHHGTGCSTNPGPNGVACSGRDRNRNGISDKEDHAINSGAKP